MESIYIEDSLHFIQGVEKAVRLKSVECLAIHQSIDYIENEMANIDASSALTVTSSIVLDYEIGVDVRLTMDAVYRTSDVASKKSIQELLSTAKFALTASKASRPSKNISFMVKNDEVLDQLKNMYKKSAELSYNYRDEVLIFGNEDVAARLIAEYEGALALKTYRTNSYFDESMRVELHRKIAEEACKRIGK
jgi:hypothetical protein